jgi:hypothetical protein
MLNLLSHVDGLNLRWDTESAVLPTMRRTSGKGLRIDSLRVEDSRTANATELKDLRGQQRAAADNDVFRRLATASAPLQTDLL